MVHYDNTPMQYSAIFHSCKIDNFRSKLKSRAKVARSGRCP